MSAHLTHEELTDSLLGVSSLTANARLLNCPACASELGRLKNSIAESRGGAHAWSENAMAGDRTVSMVGALPRRSWAANWVLAAAVVILFVAGLISYLRDHSVGNRGQSAQVAEPAVIIEGSAAQIEKDNELMSPGEQRDRGSRASAHAAVATFAVGSVKRFLGQIGNRKRDDRKKEFMMLSYRGRDTSYFHVITLSFITLLLGTTCFGQQPSPGGPDGSPHQGPGAPGRRGPSGPGGPGRGLHVGPPERWWDDPDFVKQLGLSTEQQKKMDEIFTTNRLKLAALQKEEAIMEPLVAADPPDETKLLAQIDRVAQARAELEKANARMLLGIRRQSTHEQWLKLQADRPPMHGPRLASEGGPRPAAGGAIAGMQCECGGVPQKQSRGAMGASSRSLGSIRHSTPTEPQEDL